MEKHTKMVFPNFDWHENKSGLLTGKPPPTLQCFLKILLLDTCYKFTCSPPYGGSIKGR
jgi:hypothetical protein